MSSIILKHRYQANFGFRLNQSTQGIFTWLTKWSEEVKRPTDKQIEVNGLPPKSECPGFCAAILKPKYNTSKCYITAEVMQSTDVLVLDIDDVPADVPNIGLWLPTLLPQGVKALWYSTPRYRDAKKRIRVVIRLSREITPAEKKSLQKRLPIPGVDPASYEINKFSLLPCWTEDTVDFAWGSVGHRDLDVDHDIPPFIPERQKSFAPTIRLEAASEIAKALAEVVEAINDAPDGGSQEVIKSNLSRLFRKYAITYDHCLEVADLIYRDDRRKDFVGISLWIGNKHRKK
jgi:hypothetical protein